MEQKKYSPETLSTGLLLPASAQLIIDFPTKPLHFVTDKLEIALKDAYPDFGGSPRLGFIMKELHYYVKDSCQLFGNILDPESSMAHRIFVGIMCSTLLNQDEQGNWGNKRK